jgi:hypothetical protein
MTRRGHPAPARGAAILAAKWHRAAVRRHPGGGAAAALGVAACGTLAGVDAVTPPARHPLRDDAPTRATCAGWIHDTSFLRYNAGEWHQRPCTFLQSPATSRRRFGREEKTGPTTAAVGAWVRRPVRVVWSGECHYRNRPAASTRHVACGVRCAGLGHPSPWQRPTIRVGQLAAHAPINTGGRSRLAKTSGGSLRSRVVFWSPLPVPPVGEAGS